MEACIYFLQILTAVFVFYHCRVNGEYGHYNVDEFLSMVIGNISQSKKYVPPTDNSAMVDSHDQTINDYGVFDFIIVGSGAAGAVLANRLSEINQWKILLLEAGGKPNDFTDILGMYGYFMNSEMNWGYHTTPQNSAGSISWPYPRGKVVGGSTSINGAVYARGNPADFDSWHQNGWSYKDVLPYFKKSENVKFAGWDEKYHSTDGYMHVDTCSDTPGLPSVVINAFKELGQEELGDYNGKKQLGIGKTQYNLNENLRDSSARAFLDPIETRTNFNMSLESFVTKVLIGEENMTAFAVEFVKAGKKFIAMSQNEVILSGGAINSPQILMLSGIGPKPHLEELGIETVVNLPVGSNVIDHVYFNSTKYRTTSLNFYNLTYREQAELFFENKRPLTAMSDYLSFIQVYQRISNNNTQPDIELEIDTVAPVYEDYLDSENQLQSYSISEGFIHNILLTVILLHPKARGTIRLRSNDPSDFPIIDPNLLGEIEDIETLYQGMLHMMKLNETTTFQQSGVYLEYPKEEACDSEFKKYSKEWCYCVIRLGSTVGGHIVGSTPMGDSSATSVVDSRLKVHGVQNLRVVDAGVMPSSISGHPAAAAIMIGEKAADIIKEEYGV